MGRGGDRRTGRQGFDVLRPLSPPTAAGVSLDFLYASTELRQRIEKLRAQQATGTASRAPAQPAAAEQDDIVHILTTKLRQERDARRSAISELETQLAAAHGELLRLRRLLQQHGVDPR